MKAVLHRALTGACHRLLTPLVRILLRHGVPFGVFAEMARKVYVDVAAKEFAVEGRKLSKSRVSVLTGLNRKEVKRLLELGEVDAEPMLERYDRSTRILAAWRREDRYHGADGVPRALSFEGATESFTSLVREFGGDVPARAVLDELERTGAVRVADDRSIELAERAYVSTHDDAERLAILGADVHDLVSAIDHNITHDPSDAFIQRKVAYDNLPVECLPNLRAIARDNGQVLLETLDQAMAAHDRDVHPDGGGSGRKRAMVGVYYYECDTESEQEV